MRASLRLLAVVVVAWALVWPALGRAELKLNFDLEGYYRARWYHVSNAFDTPILPNTSIPVDRQKKADFLVHRLRLVPKISLSDYVSLYVQVDALNNVVWGDNDLASSSAPVFATSTSNSNILGQQIASVEVPRAWLEFKLPIGQLRVGRMPSQWGMGLLANDGNGFRNEFDEAYGGSTADRILFATRPIQIYKALKGDRTYKSNLIFAVAYDKVVEEPCEVKSGPISNCTLLGPDDLWQRYQTDRPPGSEGWLSRNQNDVDEVVFVLLYNADKIKLWKPDDQLVAGTYIVLRGQPKSFTKDAKDTDPKDTGTFVQIYDFYLKGHAGPIYAEGEFLTILGETTGGVPLPPNTRKDVRIFGGVGRAGYVSRPFDAIFETGYASGTNNLADVDDPTATPPHKAVFSQRPLHPDYGVGLVLYRQVLRERSFQVYNNFNARGFSSGGGVIDSTYIFPRLRYRPQHPKLKGVELIGGVLAAWADKRDEILFTKWLGTSGKTRGTYLGTEIDAALKYTFYDNHMLFSLEAGYLIFGEQLRAVDPTTHDVYPGDYRAKGSWSVQSRIAFVF